jgi:hypothetical protein
VSRAIALIAALCAACAADTGPPPMSAARSYGEPVTFAFGTIDGRELSSRTTRGRTTALLFVTTFDLASQAQARLLNEVLARYRPRANGGVVMLEPPHSAALAEVWRDSLALRLPVAMASQSLLAGVGVFGDVRYVPTLIVLDRRGRVIVRRQGVLTREAMQAHLRTADAAAPGGG